MSSSSMTTYNDNGNIINSQKIKLNDNGNKDHYLRKSIIKDNGEELVEEEGNKDLCKLKPRSLLWGSGYKKYLSSFVKNKELENKTSSKEDSKEDSKEEDNAKSKTEINREGTENQTNE